MGTIKPIYYPTHTISTVGTILLCDRAFWTTRKINLETSVNFSPFSGTVANPFKLCSIYIKKISIIPVVTTRLYNEKWLHIVLTYFQTKFNLSVNTEVQIYYHQQNQYYSCGQMGVTQWKVASSSLDIFMSYCPKMSINLSSSK